MKVGILGGTGNLGKGLAMRLCTSYDILLGSRDKDKARIMAEEYTKRASARYGKDVHTIQGTQNEEAVSEADIVILAINASALEQFLEVSRAYYWDDKVVVCPATNLVLVNKLFQYSSYLVDGKSRSAAEYVQERLPTAKVVSALQLVPAAKLADLSQELCYDVPVVGDKKASLQVIECLSKIRGLRFLYAGPLSLSVHIEGMLPVLLNIARINRLKEPGIKVV